MFWYMVFSNEVNTRYTEFYFISGGNNYDTITVNLTGWETWTVVYGLDNKSTENFWLKMSFVDADVTDDGNNLKVCLSENETENFGQYITTTPNLFSVSNGTLVTGEIEMNFPAWFSGVYNGCVVYTPNITEWASHLNTVPRKAIFLDVDVVPTSSTFNIKVYPQNRGTFTKANNNWFNNIGRILFYLQGNSSVPNYSGYVVTDYDWEWVYVGDLEDWLYNVVYKWQQQLSSYIEWVNISGWSTLDLDFTSWDNLYWTVLWLEFNGWNRYQIAWDLVNSVWNQDGRVLVADLSILYWESCKYNSADYSDRCDVNNDWAVDSSDTSAIIENMFESDLCYGDIWLFDGLWLFNY